MFEPKKPFNTLIKTAVIAVPVDNKIVKLDIVKDMGLGIWFNDDDENPSIVLIYETEQDAIESMKGFKRTKLKAKMKVIEGGENNG